MVGRGPRHVGATATNSCQRDDQAAACPSAMGVLWPAAITVIRWPRSRPRRSRTARNAAPIDSAE